MSHLKRTVDPLTRGMPSRTPSDRSKMIVSFGLTGHIDDQITRAFGLASNTLGCTSPGWSTSHRDRAVVNASNSTDAGAAKRCARSANVSGFVTLGSVTSETT